MEIKVSIEIYFNNFYSTNEVFEIGNTLKDVRKRLKIENSKDYKFLFNGKEIEFNEEEKYTIKDFKSSKKIYYTKKSESNPFKLLGKNKKTSTNANNKPKELIQNNNKNEPKKKIII